MTDDTTTDCTGTASGLARGAGGRDVRFSQISALAAGLDGVDGTPRLTAREICARIVGSRSFAESAEKFARLSKPARPQYDAPWNNSLSDRAEHGTHWGTP